MAAAYRLTALQDFTGGLNLRADAFSLQRSESPDLLNVEIDPRGGIAIRRGADRYSTTSIGANRTPLTLGRHRNDAGTEYVLVSAFDSSTGRNLYAVGSGAAWTVQTGSVAASSPGRFASMKQSPSGTTFAYMVNGVDAPYRLTASGPTFTALTQTFNDTVTPDNGDMPIARMICTHKGYMWLGVTVESGTTYPHRVRWSHLGRPEDWKTNDYIDIGSDDGDVITALIADGDRLLVFKNRSIWAVYGYDTDTFTVEQISDSLGAISQEAVVETPTGIFFFHGSTGVHRLHSKGTEWVFENIQPALEDGRIANGTVYMTWARRRLYLSVLWSPTNLRRTFVYDPTIGRGGSWMLWDLPCGPMATLTGALGATTEYPISATSSQFVIKLDQNRYTDNLAGSNTSYPSTYTTSWVDANTPTVKKKWGRLRAVVRAVADASILVNVFYDYDSTSPKRSKTITVEARTAGGVWGTGSWDSAVWGGGDGTPYEVERNSSLGSSTAVQLRFEGPLGSEWSVNSIVIPFRQRRAR